MTKMDATWVGYLPNTSTILGEGVQLLLHSVHPVDAVDEQYEDEDERDLRRVS